ncbi:acetyl-CoA carboxylase biotin carboxyl carrier protein [Flavobacteriales bacterium]|nr:acetyl-CoA carboxylase biotin carboxyl carrier protein [bacterium]MDB0024995.1 acetyl-CoA carboxylase biotin carboxyl carrier protein [Flavobacteriales bacterium]
MKLTEIQDLIKFVARASVTEVEIEQKEFKITIKSEMPRGRGKKDEPIVQAIQVPAGMMQAPMMTAPAAAPSATADASDSDAEETNDYIEVKSPMIGTFYRRPAPDKDLFCEVGDVVKQGDTVCVIEAMKLFNEIESEVSGKIVKILVDDNSPVEYDQPLFLVDPS